MSQSVTAQWPFQIPKTLQTSGVSDTHSPDSMLVVSPNPESLAKVSSWNSLNRGFISSPNDMKLEAGSPQVSSHSSSPMQIDSPLTTSANSILQPSNSALFSITKTSFRSPRTRPLHKLSVGLLQTYRHINEVYLESRKRKTAPIRKLASWDDENCDYIIGVDPNFGDRYTIKTLLGKGSFGQVVQARDNILGEDFAIKIIKSKTPFYNQALIEIQILEHMNKHDPDDKFGIVFELLSINLYDLLRSIHFQGVSLNSIRKFASQILQSLHFLSFPQVSILHCDLKPENILLRNPKSSAIKIIDFGSSCHISQKMYKYIQSRFYRSPEVLLELKYSHPIDVWSLGCILVEMHTGEPLFSGQNEFDQMYRIVALLGMPPVHMIETSRKYKNFFDFKGKDEHGNSIFALKPYHKQIPKRTLDDILGVYSGGPFGRRKGDKDHSPEHYLIFKDFIEKLLVLDPELRLKPQDAVRHPFFVENEKAVSTIFPREKFQ